MRTRWLLGLVVLAGGFALSAAAPAAPAQANAGNAAVVSPRIPLNARSGPAVWHPRVATIGHGTPLTLVCQVKGQRIVGTTRVTDLWDRTASGTYVSDAYVRRDAALPACAAVPVPAAAPAPAAAHVPAAPAPAPAVVTGTVASPNVPLKTRNGPAVWHGQVGALANGTALPLVCQVKGQRIGGTIRLTDAWNRLADGTYVSDAYVRRASAPPACGTAPAAANAAAAAPAWTHPLPGFRAGNGFRAGAQTWHIGLDFMSFVGTPIRAATAGRVVEVVCNIQPGYTCDKPGSASVRGCGWYVKLAHPGRLSTIYCHMVSRPPVEAGQDVATGQVIGYVGSSGNSSFPHLHFEVHVEAPPTGPYNAVDPLPFMKARGVRL
jgi:murein DD-endopeptidase MepM/ murein hydrolase activator NlpD